VARRFLAHGPMAPRRADWGPIRGQAAGRRGCATLGGGRGRMCYCTRPSRQPSTFSSTWAMAFSASRSVASK
jgi:hypothetical protein